MDLLSDLTPAQREAVTHLDGPLLIIAGAGSGKTRVITRRVGYLLQQGVRPWNILAITFTNKAAGEMRQRVETLAPRSRVWISTFHSFGARILRQYADRLGLDRNFTIYDQDDRKKVVQEALAAANIDNVHFTPDRIQAAISRAKNQLLDPPGYTATATDFFGQTVARVYPLYEKKLRDGNALDFDDLLYWVARVLQTDREIRAELDERFRYVLIDEYQDTNYAQYALARGLSQDYPNLCVVGDPDQSIYRWRGSDIRNILDFERDYPDARVITLEKNYRSTKTILRSASHVIAHNKKRKPKSLVTDNPEGRPVTVLTFASGLDEADGIASRIKEAVRQNGRNYRDCAIFLRINALSRALETAMIRRQVPYQIVRGLAFFERKENKDILAYLRLLLNPRDDISFLRVVNEPPRGIGKVSLEHLKMYAVERDLGLLAAAAEVHRISAIRGKAIKGLADFAKLIHELAPLADAPAEEAIRQVIDKSGYRGMLKTGDDEDMERLANIVELITAAHQFLAEDSENTIRAFLEQVTLASDVDGWDENQDQVSIMTLHAAKGLEFPVVFIAAVEQGLLPHERSNNNAEELEEERRLVYVGMTRAKHELYLCNAAQREFRGSLMYAIPSQFLDELPNDGVERLDLSNEPGGSRDGFAPDVEPSEEPPTFRPPPDRTVARSPVTARKLAASAPVPGADYRGMTEGCLVRHQIYGIGKVTALSGYGAMRKARVRFGTVGEKTFVLEKAPLELVKRNGNR